MKRKTEIKQVKMGSNNPLKPPDKSEWKNFLKALHSIAFAAMEHLF